MSEATNHERPALYSGGGSRPVPDPTELTATLVNVAIGNLREILEKEIDGNRRTLEARLNGNDKAIELLQTQQTKSVDTLQAQIDARPAEIDARIKHLQDLFDERFKTVGVEFRGIQVQFDERDTRVKESATATATAVAAALQAAKEAVGALESLARRLSGESTLGKSAVKLQARQIIDAPTAKILTDLYEYRNRTPGVGHGGATPPASEVFEARLIVNLCASALLFLVELDT